MTDRLERITAALTIGNFGLYNSDIEWLIAELQETRRLGNQLADALHEQLTAAEMSPIHSAPLWAWRQLDAWRTHQKDNDQ